MTTMNPASRIYIAGHRGLVGSAILLPGIVWDLNRILLGVTE